MSHSSEGVTVSHLVAACERLWPISGAEDWDNAGLQVGRMSRGISRVLLAVDVVAETVAQAKDGQFDAVIAHHPLILRGLQTVAESTYKGHLISELVRNEVALLAMHTNADVVTNGVSDVLARALDLHDVAPIQPTAGPEVGIGRHGHLIEPTTLGKLAQRLAELLPATVPGVAVSGDFNQSVTKVSLCGGAGDSLLECSGVRSSDVFITSDLRHHRASESREASRISGGPALINVSHWASEWLWLETAANALRGLLPGVDFVVSDVRTDPWDFVVTQ